MKKETFPCWRCGKPAEPMRVGGFGAALLVISYADSSFSGTFRVPLCTDCLTHPHNNADEDAMGRVLVGGGKTGIEEVLR